jgi:2-beta-glucuronyltransferase
MKRAVLFTGHYYGSKRKAGFHWIAESLLRKGWEVLFFTAPLSYFSILRRDYRLQYPIFGERGKLIEFDKRLSSYVWFTPWHPVNYRLSFLNNLSRKLFVRYGDFSLGEAKSFIENSSLFIFESNPVLFLVERIKRLCPEARMVYRVSDDLRLLHPHPALIELEQRLTPLFDLISVPSQHVFNLFKGQSNLKLQLHGIRKDLYDKPYPNPYRDTEGPNLIFIGQAHFDYNFLEQARRIFPDWHFHLIGPISKVSKSGNVHVYGEMSFEDTIPYIKNADIGLHTLKYSRGAESFSDSLKVIQYEYCKLPVVAPNFLKCNRPQVHYYKPGDDNSIKEALLQANSFNRAKISTDKVNSWDELTTQLTGEKSELKYV